MCVSHLELLNPRKFLDFRRVWPLVAPLVFGAGRFQCDTRLWTAVPRDVGRRVDGERHCFVVQWRALVANHVLSFTCITTNVIFYSTVLHLVTVRVTTCLLHMGYREVFVRGNNIYLTMLSSG